MTGIVKNTDITRLYGVDEGTPVGAEDGVAGGLLVGQDLDVLPRESIIRHQDFLQRVNIIHSAVKIGPDAAAAGTGR